MATRTPGTSTLFPDGQPRQQFGRDWGNYTTVPGMPNGSGNTLAAREFTVEAGDRCYLVTGAQAGLLYICVYAGTSGGGDALWVPVFGPFAFTTVNANFNITTAFSDYYIDNSGGPFSGQLPDPAVVGKAMWRLYITSGTQNVVTLLRFGGETIQGLAANRAIQAPYGRWILVCDGVNYNLLGQNRASMIFRSSGTFTPPAGVARLDVIGRPGAGGAAGGGGGGGGFGGATGGGGGGGRGGGGGASAMNIATRLQVTPGNVLTITVGAGGVGGTAGTAGPPNAAGGAGGSGGAGSVSEILAGATSLYRWSRTGSAGGIGCGAGGTGGGAGAAGTAGAGGAGATTGGTTTAASSCYPGGWGTTSLGGGNGGGGAATGTSTNGSSAGGVGAQATNGPAGFPGLLASELGGSSDVGTATHGAGGGGGAGGGAVIGACYDPDGTSCATNSGQGGGRVTNEGNGGAGVDVAVGTNGVAGDPGEAGTYGMGGGGGQGGGGGGGAATTGGSGGAGGAGGAGSDGMVYLSWME